MIWKSVLHYLPLVFAFSASAASQKPNIVFIFTDDQDLHHGSLDSMSAVQKHLVHEGTTFAAHYATVAVCCPSRVSLMRGQAAHNTNNTAVQAPGGGYQKFLASNEFEDYLPHWISKAGYKTDYIGKLYNGVNLRNYSPAPKGWDHIDVLLEPYINELNSVVMSQNGARPVWYRGFQQTDVLRIKALAQLQDRLESDDPFFLMIAPTAPHVQGLTTPPVPPSRYNETFANATLDRKPNFNPQNNSQKGKPAWLRNVPLLNQTQIDDIDLLHRRRLQSLQGVDDIVADIVGVLEKHNQLDNTYIIYSTDQGYHLGTHRHVGKCLPYLEDTNIPLVIRGPGVPRGVKSSIPSTITDFAPTFLDIARLPKKLWPPFLDGTSMLPSWKNPCSKTLGKKKAVINIEYWGSSFTEIPTWSDGDYPTFPGLYLNNTYKTLRIVTEDQSWMYSRWCGSNSTELYDTTNDPFELENLALSNDPAIHRVLTRLNALLLVTKSCQGNTCRDPWSLFNPNTTRKHITSLKEALDHKYDELFSSFPLVTINECNNVQLASNERPFFPTEAEFGLGLEYRTSPNFYDPNESNPQVRIAGNEVPAGGWEQRIASLDQVLTASRELTDEEIENTGP